MRRFRLFAIVAAVFVTAILLTFLELTVRVLDGYPLLGLRLGAPRARTAPEPGGNLDDRHLPNVPLADGVRTEWYRIDPPKRTGTGLPDKWTARHERYKITDPFGAFFVWNHEYLRFQLCEGLRFGSLGILDDFFVFEPPTKTLHPSYRHLAHISPIEWFPTNNFGWRGPDVPLNKPDGTIRIAYIGSSMTIDPYGAPFSHIEYIEVWLNEWLKAKGLPYHAEVINAARTGIDASSAAGVVIQELLPLEPDLVVFDGANDFKPGMLYKSADLAHPPPADPMAPWAIEQWSALAKRMHVVITRLTLGDEPVKPEITVQWPADVDEQNPPIDSRTLPMALTDLMDAFEAMRRPLADQGGELAVSTQATMVYDGMKLSLPRHATLYRNLNVADYPMKYKDLRRLMDFENRLVRAYAAKHSLLLFDKATLMPADPDLYADEVHLIEPGRRLQSWQYLQWLIAWLQPRLDAGTLPRKMQHPRETHPVLASEYPLLSREALLAECPDKK